MLAFHAQTLTDSPGLGRPTAWPPAPPRQYLNPVDANYTVGQKMKLNASDIDRLLRAWASAVPDEMGVTKEEYSALCEHAGLFKHRHLEVVIRATKNDRLREQVMKYEIPARALLKNPLEGRLVVAALILGTAASIATIASAVKSFIDKGRSPTTVVGTPASAASEKVEAKKQPNQPVEPTSPAAP